MANVQNISLLQEVIKSNPEKFNMNSWCGTAKCIGGWCNAIEKIDPNLGATARERAAANFLGLLPDEADRLFYPWSISLSKWEDITIQEAVDHLEHIKLGNPVDWTKFVDDTPDFVADGEGRM